MEMTGHQYIQQLTREDALAWRASELGGCQASTVKTRLRFLSGLFKVAVEEQFIDNNPFEWLTSNLRQKQKKKDVLPLDQADALWEKLPRHHQLVWQLARWAAAHISEVAGLLWDYIDLQEETIHFASHETRPLKNVFRDRVIPIHSRLLSILRQEHSMSLERG